MNIVVDQGNTICKVAICSSDRVIKSYALPKLTLVEAEFLIARHPTLTGALYSSVGEIDRFLLQLLKDRIPYTIYLDNDISVPIEVMYDRTQIGSDRLAAAVAGNYLAPGGTEILVIDSGTAITYERITSEGIYLGGNISPGLRTRFKSLHHFTSRLPLITEHKSVGTFGCNTKEAIINGVMKGIIYEIDSYIDELKIEYPNLTVILAGGDSICFQHYLRNKVYTIRNLVALGLNIILEHNKNLHNK